MIGLNILCYIKMHIAKFDVNNDCELYCVYVQDIACSANTIKVRAEKRETVIERKKETKKGKKF